MNNMYNQYPNYSYFAQPQSYARQQAPMLKGRQVASIEEARAASIDFDGSVFYFPDLANKRIYTKQINLDGTATLNLYELKEIPVSVPANVDLSQNYVTREEFDTMMAKMREDILNLGQAKITF